MSIHNFGFYSFFHYLYALKKRVHTRTPALFCVFAGLTAKGLKIIEFLKHFRLKYLIASLVTLFMVQSMFGFAQDKRIGSDILANTPVLASDSITPQAPTKDSVPTARQARSARRNRVLKSDSSATVTQPAPALPKADTTRRKRSSGLDQVVEGKNTDSLYYDVVNRKVYIYNQGDIKYEDKSLKADYMRIDMNTKERYAYGKPDTVDGKAT